MKNSYKVIAAGGILGLTLINEKILQGSFPGKIIITLGCIVLIGLILRDKIHRENRDKQEKNNSEKE